MKQTAKQKVVALHTPMPPPNQRKDYTHKWVSAIAQIRLGNDLNTWVYFECKARDRRHLNQIVEALFKPKVTISHEQTID